MGFSGEGTKATHRLTWHWLESAQLLEKLISLQENASLPTACPGRQRHKPSRQRLCRPQSHVAVGKEQSAKPGSAKADLPTAMWHTVGKAFANCHASSRHSHVAPSALTAGFADCWFLGGRQRIFFSKIVCRLAASSAVGKERKYFFFEMFFADCFRSCSRQRFDLFADCLPLQSAKTLSWVFLPSFADCKQSAKLEFFFLLLFSVFSHQNPAKSQIIIQFHQKHR